MRLKKSWLIGGGIVLVLVIGGIWKATSSSAQVTFVTDTVQRGSLKQTVDVTGELQSVTDLSLAFDTSGSVRTIKAKIGDAVKAGDVIATLGADELAAAVDQAHQAVLQAQASLDAKNAGISTEEEAAQRASVAVAQAQVDAATIDASNALLQESTGNAADAASVASSQSDYDQVAAKNAEAQDQASEDLATALTAGLVSVRGGLATADQIFAVNNSLLDDEYHQYLGVNDPSAMSEGRAMFVQAEESRDAAEDALIALSDTPTVTEMTAIYTSTNTAFTQVSSTLLYAARALDASMSDSGTFSNADLNSLKSMIAAERTAVASAQAALMSSKQAFDTTIRENADRLTDATNALALAKANQSAGKVNRAATVAKANASLLVQQASLVQAQAALDQVLAKPRSVDVAGLEAAVGSAEANERAALARLRKTEIVAPIDGVISDIAYDIGEQVSAGQEMVTMFAQGDAYEIALDIPESDISKIAVGQATEITFDAFGDKVKFSGSVYSINPAQKVIQDVVFYEAKVVLSDENDVSVLKPGMSANVTILTNMRDGALHVPSRSVLEKDGKPYVRVPKNDHEFDERFVTTGLKADDGLTEITEGLNENETVIVTVKSE
jgi:HlyD family secretion protein